MKNNYQQGFSAVEVMVVIAIIVVIIAVVLPQFARTKELQVLKNAVSDVLSSIDKARTQTLSSLDSSEYGVRFESDKVIIFKGMVYSSGSVNNETTDITSPANISNVTLNSASSSSGEMYFNRLSGSPSKTGTVTISTTNYSKIITISATGASSVN